MESNEMLSLMTSGESALDVVDCASMSMKQMPVIQDSMSFESRQAMRLVEMERRMMEEIQRREREWERNVEEMRDEFLNLYPSDSRLESSVGHTSEDNGAMKRFGSTDVLDVRRMKTTFFEYPSICEPTQPLESAATSEDVSEDTVPDSSVFSGRRFQLRFNVSDFEPETVKVTTDEMRIVVYAVRLEEDGYGITTEREYSRKIRKPKEIDHSKLEAYVTADGILLIEAALKRNPTDVGGHGRLSHSASRSSHGSRTSRSSQGSKSPASSSPGTPSKEKVGVPVFRDENGTRRMHLTVDLGSAFEPEDVTIQVIKENRIQVRAKHRVKTSDRLSKNKFNKEYELGEKIETLTLRGGLTSDGKLIVGAVAKGHTATAAAASGVASDPQTQ